MTVKDWTYQHILPQVSWLAMNLLCSTLRIHTLGEDDVERLRKEKENSISQKVKAINNEKKTKMKELDEEIKIIEKELKNTE